LVAEKQRRNACRQIVLNDRATGCTVLALGFCPVHCRRGSGSSTHLLTDRENLTEHSQMARRRKVCLPHCLPYSLHADRHRLSRRLTCPPIQSSETVSSHGSPPNNTDIPGSSLEPGMTSVCDQLNTAWVIDWGITDQVHIQALFPHSYLFPRVASLTALIPPPGAWVEIRWRRYT
jgi:hypothetical protein